jgi:predicted  nucleic acid-binding Zn-ribbon protein
MSSMFDRLEDAQDLIVRHRRHIKTLRAKNKALREQVSVLLAQRDLARLTGALESCKRDERPALHSVQSLVTPAHPNPQPAK